MDEVEGETFAAETINKSTDLNDENNSNDFSDLNCQNKSIDIINHDLNIKDIRPARLKSIIKEDNRLLSHSAPNLVSSSSPLTSGEYTEQFIRKNLTLFNKFHNLDYKEECDCNLEDSEEAILEPNENVIQFDQHEFRQLNENAIDFLKNFTSHKHLHQFDKENGADEQDVDNLVNYNEARKKVRNSLENDQATNLINNSINDLLTDEMANYLINDEYVKVKFNKTRFNLSYSFTGNFMKFYRLLKK